MARHLWLLRAVEWRHRAESDSGISVPGFGAYLARSTEPSSGRGRAAQARRHRSGADRRGRPPSASASSIATSRKRQLPAPMFRIERPNRRTQVPSSGATTKRASALLPRPFFYEREIQAGWCVLVLAQNNHNCGSGNIHSCSLFSRNHRCGEHPLGAVVDRHHAIAINHPVISNHVTTVAGRQAGCIDCDR